MEHEQDHPPFQSELIDHPEIQNEFNRFLALKNNPAFIVKEYDANDFQVPFEETPDERQEGETQIAFLERIGARGQKLQREFSEITGINTVTSQLVIGASEHGTKVMYRVNEQVFGDDLDEAIKGAEPSNDELEAVIRAEFDYFKAKLESGEDYASDIASLRQFRYGHTADNPQTAIYLSDTDPFFKRGEHSVGSNNGLTKFSLGQHTLDLVEMIDEIQAVRPDFAPELRQEIGNFVRTHMA